MDNIKKGLFGIAVILFIYWIYSETTRLPSSIVREAKSVSTLLDRYQNTLKGEINYLQKLKQSNDWQPLERYAQKEQWDKTIDGAATQLEQLKSLYKVEVEKLLDRNHKDDVPKLKDALTKIKKEANIALKMVKKPRETVAFINESIKNKEQLYSNATDKLESSNNKLDEFITKAESTVVSFPKKSEIINKNTSEVKAIFIELQKAVERLVKQYKSSDTDFLEYGNAFAQAKLAEIDLNKMLKNKAERLDDLNRDFVKVLTDQKVDYFIIIGRANWCEGEYCDDGSQMRYPAVNVDDDTMKYFSNSNVSPIAQISGSWGKPSFRLNIPENRWNALGIDKYYRWNRSKPYAEYWVEQTVEKTFHRYTTIENGKVDEGRWQEVPNKYFWDNYENLGMALVTKPIGSFVSESIQTPEPVGLATVAKPEMVDGVPTGSNKYGEWRRDSSGNSFWFYYSMYRILGDFGYGRYGYNDWYGYSTRDRSRPYYGSSGQYGTFGKNTYNNSRYSNSSFSKRNPNARKSAMLGKRSSVASSVRGSGSSNRGKGPSRSGK